jgi:hypothetical protein
VSAACDVNMYTLEVIGKPYEKSNNHPNAARKREELGKLLAKLENKHKAWNHGETSQYTFGAKYGES